MVGHGEFGFVLSTSYVHHQASPNLGLRLVREYLRSCGNDGRLHSERIKQTVRG